MKHLFIDNENVHLKSLPDLGTEPCQVWLFVGVNQTPSSMGQLYEDIIRINHQNIHKINLIRCDRKGDNALDFCLAYYMGYVNGQGFAPHITLCVLSKDSGFDALIQYLMKTDVEHCRGVIRLTTLDLFSLPETELLQKVGARDRYPNQTTTNTPKFTIGTSAYLDPDFTENHTYHHNNEDSSVITKVSGFLKGLFQEHTTETKSEFVSRKPSLSPIPNVITKNPDLYRISDVPTKPFPPEECPDEKEDEKEEDLLPNPNTTVTTFSSLTPPVQHTPPSPDEHNNPTSEEKPTVATQTETPPETPNKTTQFTPSNTAIEVGSVKVWRTLSQEYQEYYEKYKDKFKNQTIRLKPISHEALFQRINGVDGKDGILSDWFTYPEPQRSELVNHIIKRLIKKTFITIDPETQSYHLEFEHAEKIINVIAGVQQMIDNNTAPRTRTSLHNVMKVRLKANQLPTDDPKLLDTITQMCVWSGKLTVNKNTDAVFYQPFDKTEKKTPPTKTTTKPKLYKVPEPPATCQTRDEVLIHYAKAYFAQFSKTLPTHQEGLKTGMKKYLGNLVLDNEINHLIQLLQDQHIINIQQVGDVARVYYL